MQTWFTFAFLTAAAACIICLFERSWAVALLGASLAFALVPAVFQLS